MTHGLKVTTLYVYVYIFVTKLKISKSYFWPIIQVDSDTVFRISAEGSITIYYIIYLLKETSINIGMSAIVLQPTVTAY